MLLQGIKDLLDEKFHLRRVQESYAIVGDLMLDEILRGWGVCGGVAYPRRDDKINQLF